MVAARWAERSDAAVAVPAAPCGSRDAHAGADRGRDPASGSSACQRRDSRSHFQPDGAVRRMRRLRPAAPTGRAPTWLPDVRVPPWYDNVIAMPEARTAGAKPGYVPSSLAATGISKRSAPG